MKMVHGNAVFIREEAKLTRNTLTGIHLQCETSLLSTPLTSLSICKQHHWLQEIISSPDYEVMLGCYPKKVGTYAELKASHFLNN